MREIYLGEFTSKEKEVFLREITKSNGKVVAEEVVWPDDLESEEVDELLRLLADRQRWYE